MKDILIIVESPAKAKTISKFLDGIDVIASKGHIRDLPVHNLGIQMENGKYTPKYEITANHEAIVKDIKYLAKNKRVYLASDEDREGEAIGYHIACILGGDPTGYDRITFHEITKSAILKALEHPRKLDMHAVAAQEARRMLDRIVGYKLSPLLSAKIESKLSAGRVQSATLKLIYDKEKAIQTFQPETYYENIGWFNKEFKGLLYKVDGKSLPERNTDKSLAELIRTRSEELSWVVESSTNTERKTSPKPPFTTSTLQQAASTTYGYAPDRTMSIAQRLYEGVDTHTGHKGVITYMRTDSLNLADEAIVAIRAEISNQFGDRYLHSEPRKYATKSKGAQEAHEAIRVTDVTFTPELAKRFLEPEQLKIYTLIYNRTMMCQMADAISLVGNMVVTGSDDTVKLPKTISYVIKGRMTLFDGWTKLLPTTKEDLILPMLSKGNFITLTKAEMLEKQTEPPARYNQASIVKAMEDVGIGRPSTYAATVALLLKRQYVKVENKALYMTERGNKVIDLLDAYFKEITDANFTSAMETQLDEIALGHREMNQVIDGFVAPLLIKVKEGYENIPSQKVVKPTGEKCPKCNSDLVERQGRYGKIIGCSAFPKCKYIKNDRKEVIKLDVPCPDCGGELVERLGRFGKFYSCNNYPKCKFISNFPIAKEKCPKCGNWQQVRTKKDGETWNRCLKCNPPLPKTKKGK